MSNMIFAAILFFLAGIGGVIFGTGNYSGWFGAVITGLVLGLLLASRFFFDRELLAAAVIFAGIFLGSLASNAIPDSHWFKVYLRTQTSLYVHVFGYKFGTESKKLP